MNRLRYQNYKNENTETRHLNNIQKKNRILKVKNSLLGLEKDLKKLRDREIKIRRVIEKLF